MKRFTVLGSFGLASWILEFRLPKDSKGASACPSCASASARIEQNGFRFTTRICAVSGVVNPSTHKPCGPSPVTPNHNTLIPKPPTQNIKLFSCNPNPKLCQVPAAEAMKGDDMLDEDLPGNTGGSAPTRDDHVKARHLDSSILVRTDS